MRLKSILKSQLLKNIFITIKNNKPVFLVLIALGLVVDIFFFDSQSDVRIFAILALSILSIIVYKFSSQFVFQFCLVLLSLMFLFYAFSGTSVITERIAVWLFLFLAIGIIAQWKNENQ